MIELIAAIEPAVNSGATLDGWKLFVALGGLVLGLINLAYLLYKEVIRKLKLLVEIESAAARASRQGTIALRIDLKITALHGDI